MAILRVEISDDRLMKKLNMVSATLRSALIEEILNAYFSSVVIDDFIDLVEEKKAGKKNGTRNGNEKSNGNGKSASKKFSSVKKGVAAETSSQVARTDYEQSNPESLEGKKKDHSKVWPEDVVGKFSVK